MSKKVLYVASTDIHLNNFHLPYMQLFQEKGFEVHAAYNGSLEFSEADIIHKVKFDRSPFSLKNLKALMLLIKLMRIFKFEVIHCHTPTASVIVRLAYILSFQWKSFIFYTAHGFIFYKGSPLKNWLIFYPIEILMSFATDCIITMNNEDWGYINKPWFRCKYKYNIDGIGVNPDRLALNTNSQSLNNLRAELKIEPKDQVFIYIGEFNKRKNHRYIFDAIRKLIECTEEKFVVLFAGGFSTEKKYCAEYAKKHHFENHLRFLGYRNDISNLIAISDIGITSSKTEGLPIGVLELMFSKKLVLASNIRGHKEILKDGENGFLFDLSNSDSLKNKMLLFLKNTQLSKEVGDNAPKTIEKFLLKNSFIQMTKIYNDCLHKFI
tara:strand:- start:16 stop:1155 length:1140 start_codon:yes stop_codon:yes gene_type:complete